MAELSIAASSVPATTASSAASTAVTDTGSEAVAAVKTPAGASAPSGPDVVGGLVSIIVDSVLNPFASLTGPDVPATTAAAWTLLAFARRELEQTSGSWDNTANALTASVTTSAPTAERLSVTAAAAPEAATFTGTPSFLTQVSVFALRVVRLITDVTGIDFLSPVTGFIVSDNPPFYTTLGLNVQRSEVDGIAVYSISSGAPSGKYVVALHGGSFVLQPTILHWFDYASMARDTGATVIVPIYPLAPTTEGTAGNVIPATADLISKQITLHGAENVSVYGDSAGGAIALGSVQELVRRGDPVPSHMVLLSPALDLTGTNPALQFIDDPVLRLPKPGEANPSLNWAGGLALDDPLVSPLYGSLAGLPPTAVYAGSLELPAADVLALQDKALALGAADNFTFVLRTGQIHDWAMGGLPLNPEAVAVRPDIYRQLGIGSSSV